MAILSHNPYGQHIITASRAGRPSSRFAFLKNIKPKHDENCFFCSKEFPQDQLISQWPKEGQWEVARLRNRFPIIGPHNSNVEDTHELIVPSPIHSMTFGTLSLKAQSNILPRWRGQSPKFQKRKTSSIPPYSQMKGPGLAQASLISILSFWG
jgi:galactose-1-phosphate uridylyltransferase